MSTHKLPWHSLEETAMFCSKRKEVYNLKCKQCDHSFYKLAFIEYGNCCPCCGSQDVVENEKEVKKT